VFPELRAWPEGLLVPFPEGNETVLLTFEVDMPPDSEPLSEVDIEPLAFKVVAPDSFALVGAAAPPPITVEVPPNTVGLQVVKQH
jgi:hypothetical protein